MDRKRALAAVLLVLLLGLFLLLFSSKPSHQPPHSSPSEPQRSKRDAATGTGEGCCEMAANPLLKNQGRVLVTFPPGVNTSRTMVYLYQAGAPTQLALSTGSGAFSVPPGTYDVEVQTIRLTGVPVKASHDTRVKVGVLRISMDNTSTYRILDEAQQREVAKGYGTSVFGLPAGRYVVQLRTRGEHVTIEDGMIVNL